MQRIISLEASRNSSYTSEFVSKRLCCSFMLTVTFFALVGGFFLGRFATDKTLYKMRAENSEAWKKLMTLDGQLKYFHDYLNSTNVFTLNCNHFSVDSLDLGQETIIELLDALNSCFNYG